MTSADKSFTPLISISSFDFPTQLDKKYGIVRGNTWIEISYLKGTFTIGVWYIDPVHTPGTRFCLGKPLRFETQDLLELIRRNPVLQDYEFGLKARAKHALFVILDGRDPNAFIAPFDMLEFLHTIPNDKIVTEIRKLASDRVISAESSQQFKLSELSSEKEICSDVDPRKAQTSKRDKAQSTIPEDLPMVLDLHPLIRQVSEKLFMDGHYSQCIFEAYKALNNHVKAKSGRKDLDGKDLMAKVFSAKHPVLALNALREQTDKDEQEGFMFLYMGAMEGIRNPKAHETLQQGDPKKTLEYLALASLLARRVDESKKLEGQNNIEETARDSRTTSVSPNKEARSLNKEQLDYRLCLKEEIITVRMELDNFVNPSETPYPVWLCNHDPTLRRRLVGNNVEHDLMQKFYTTLQNRYNHQKTMLTPDSKFAELNTECIRAYDKVIMEVGFASTETSAVEKLQTYAQLSEILSNIFVRNPNPVDYVPISNRVFDKINEIMERERYLIADSASEAWRNSLARDRILPGGVVLNLRFLLAFQSNLKYHLDFLRRQMQQ